MRRLLPLAFLLTLAIAGGVWQASHRSTVTTGPSPSPGSPATATTRTGPACCYPDPTLTPGVFNPAVTQETIGQTILVRGWTKTVRPPASYTDKLKRDQMEEHGLPGPPDAYEEDHFVPLELGGDPRDPKNLWPMPRERDARHSDYPAQPGTGAETKDEVEDWLHARLRDGSMTLDEARRLIVQDWYAVTQRADFKASRRGK